MTKMSSSLWKKIDESLPVILFTLLFTGVIVSFLVSFIEMVSK